MLDISVSVHGKHLKVGDKIRYKSPEYGRVEAGIIKIHASESNKGRITIKFYHSKNGKETEIVTSIGSINNILEVV